MAFLTVATFLVVIILALEAFFLARTRREFRWLVAVGGVRGKSSVTRLIAGSLRTAGIRVMARTTGSRPVVIFPDGREAEINRPGGANILEGKRFLRLARKERAEAVVVELMAIKPECLEAEVKKIFKPDYLVFTNFRPDHVEELGRTREEVARRMLGTISRRLKGTKVFILEEEVLPGVKEDLARGGARLVIVPRQKNFAPSSGEAGFYKFKSLAKKASAEKQGFGQMVDGSSGKEPVDELNFRDLRLNYGDDFAANIRLALAVTRHLRLQDETALAGMKQARPDFGSLKIWEIAAPGKAPGYVASAFAANDPESSFLVIKKIKEFIPPEGRKIYGLLLFRPDRGDRTDQWLQALKAGYLADFDGLFLSGCPYFPWKRLASPNIKRLKPEAVKSLTEFLSQTETSPWILIGLGNIVGLGGELVALWERVGRRIHG